VGREGVKQRREDEVEERRQRGKQSREEKRKTLRSVWRCQEVTAMFTEGQSPPFNLRIT